MAHWIGSTALLVVLVAPISMALGVHMFLKESVLQMFVAVSAVVFFLSPTSRQLHYRIDPLVVTLLAMLLLGFLSAIWSANADYTVVHLLRWVTAGFIAGAVLQIRSNHERILILRYLFASGAFVAVLGAMQHLGGFDLIAQAKPPAATFANRNMAMHIIVLTWWLGPLLMMLDQGNWRQYGYAIGAALMLAFATYTETRAALIAIGVEIVLLGAYFIVTRVRGVAIPDLGKINYHAVAAGVAILILLTNLGPEGFDPVWAKDVNLSQLADPIQDETGYERLVVWGSTLDIIKDHALLGVGLGAYETVYPSYSFGNAISLVRAHNDYLQMVAELGLIGGLLMISVLGILIWRGLFFLFVAREGAILSLSLLVMLGGIAVVALFSFPMQLMAPLSFIGVLIGLLMGLEETNVVAVKRLTGAALTAPVMLVVVFLNLDWGNALLRLDNRTASSSWQTSPDLHTSLQHPMFARSVRILAQRYQTSQPQWAESIARGYHAIDQDDVIINNTLALALILQKKYEEADEILVHTRPLEPQGYYRSYENEIISATSIMDRQRLRTILDELDRGPRGLLSMQQSTLVQMAKTAFNLGDVARAEGLIRENLALHPRDFETHRTLLLILNRTKRREEADAHLGKLESFGLSQDSIERLRAR